MSVSIPEWLGVIGGVLSLCLLLGAVLAIVRGSYNKARITALREDNEDLRHRVGYLDGELERHKESERQKDERHTLEKEAVEARLQRVEEENSLLRDMVTQRAQVEAVEEAVRDHHEKALHELDRHHTASIAAWEQIANGLALVIERNKG